MATYKGIAFPDQVAPLVKHMGSLNDHRETLASLSGTWDTLSLLGHLSNLKTDMGGVRQGFIDLTGELLACLAEETLSNSRSSLSHQARIAVDMLTRNLFERTADIGFLATDSVIVSACASEDPDELAELRERFIAYVKKYSVYKDIVLLRPDGQVIARMKDGFSGRSVSDIVSRSIATSDSYVETYAKTDFCDDDWALTYAYRVEQGGRTIGVLALEFDVHTEVRTILAPVRESSIMVAFVAADGRILLSSDRVALPTGYFLPLRKGAMSVRLGGVSYLVVQHNAQPYQGYAGPGWSAVALLAAEIAFDGDGAADAPVAFTGESVFSSRLLAIPEKARQIQNRLDRLVWNGRVQQADDSNMFSRALLEEIATTGRKTKDVFERSSAELLSMVSRSLLNEVQFLAGLSVDILDRNLYERANDCRWWAASPALASFDAKICHQTLKYINGLYTVYSNVFVFDLHGVVIASSQDGSIVGQSLTGPWVGKCLSTRDPMGYAVSAFEESALYGGQKTYVYSAPIFNDGQVAGGVGLVFDSTPQFAAMLEAALPKTAGSTAAFCRSDGTIISQTAQLPLQLPEAVLKLSPGETWSGVVRGGDAFYSVGATAGSGYREFKTSDGYSEVIVGIVVVPCGGPIGAANKSHGRMVPEPGGVEIATFYVGEQLMGVPAKEVVECIDVTSAVRVAGAALIKHHVGFTTWADKALPLLDLTLNAHEMSRNKHDRQAMVLRSDSMVFGLLVSQLGPVINMHVSSTQSQTMTALNSSSCAQIGRAGEVLVPILSVAEMLSVNT